MSDIIKKLSELSLSENEEAVRNPPHVKIKRKKKDNIIKDGSDADSESESPPPTMKRSSYEMLENSSRKKPTISSK